MIDTTVITATSVDVASTETAAVAAVETPTVDVLGGTETAATAETAETVTKRKIAKTPGKAARAKSDAEKRTYTARGTTYWARRVILLNGEPVGRGRPAIEGKGERKVVYVPVGMDYDAAVHGEGVKYNSNSHKATHKRLRKDSVSYTFDDGVAPAKNAKPAKKGKGKSAKTAKPAKKGKTGKAIKKASKGKGKSVTAPVVDVTAAAPVEAPVAAAPTDAVTA